MNDIFKQVDDFNLDILGLPVPEKPTMLQGPRKDWALTALREEVDEFADAETVEEQMDALGDLMFFAAGRFTEAGVAAHPVIAEITRANMSKERGSLSKRPGSMGYDAVKPDGWKAPEHVLRPHKRAAKPKIVVVGYAGHGKDTVANRLASRHGFDYKASSMYCAEHIIFPKMYHLFSSVQTCYNVRDDWRPEWRAAIEEYLTDDQARLGRKLLSDHDIYCGIRSVAEMEAVHDAGIADLVVWVDATERLPDEPLSSCEINKSYADIVIENNGEEIELLEKVDRLAALL